MQINIDKSRSFFRRRFSFFHARSSSMYWGSTLSIRSTVFELINVLHSNEIIFVVPMYESYPRLIIRSSRYVVIITFFDKNGKENLL